MLSQNLERGSNFASDMLILAYLLYIHKVYTLAWGEEGLKVYINV